MIFEQVARDLRSELISQLRKEENGLDGGNNGQGKNNDAPATKKQKQALHKFGIEQIPDDLTKERASDVLDVLISLSKERNSEAISKIVDELNAGGD